MPRVVVDTSVLLRYLIRPSAAIRTLIEDRWLADSFVMLTAPELFDELTSVLGRDYIQKLIRPEEGQVLLDAITTKAEMLPRLRDIPPYSRDPKDDTFIACAVIGDADYIVTVDEDLLALKSVDDIRIVTPANYLQLEAN